MLFGDPFPIVRYSNNYLVLYQILNTHFCSAVHMAVFYGIHQQITYYLLYFFHITQYINRFLVFNIKGEGNFFF